MSDRESDYETVESDTSELNCTEAAGEYLNENCSESSFYDKKAQDYINILKDAPMPRGKSYPRVLTNTRKSNNNKKRKISPSGDNNTGQTDQVSHPNQGFNDAFSEILNEIKELRQDTNDLRQELRQDTSRIDNRLENIERSLVIAENKLITLEKDNKCLRDNLEKKDKEIQELKYRVDSIEQRERRFQLVVSSPEILSLGEDNFKDRVVEMLVAKLRLTKDYLDSRFSVRRIGKEDNRRALLTASSLEDKINLIKTTRKEKPNGLFMGDSLIKSREDLFYNIRKYRRDNKLKFSAFSFKGDIYIKKEEEDEPVCIRSKNEIEKLFVQSTQL